MERVKDNGLTIWFSTKWCNILVPHDERRFKRSREEDGERKMVICIAYMTYQIYAYLSNIQAAI